MRASRADSKWRVALARAASSAVEKGGVREMWMCEEARGVGIGGRLFLVRVLKIVVRVAWREAMEVGWEV
jgi:hypothetical protein